MARVKSIQTKYFGYVDPENGLNRHVFALVKDISVKHQVRFSRELIWSTYQITLEDITTAFNEFAGLTGIPIENITFQHEGRSGYYNDDYESNITFVGARPETDEEQNTRLEFQADKIKKAKEVAKRAAKIRQENEIKEYERLKAKFEK